jgi:hypothetical protein
MGSEARCHSLSVTQVPQPLGHYDAEAKTLGSGGDG